MNVQLVFFVLQEVVAQSHVILGFIALLSFSTHPSSHAQQGISAQAVLVNTNQPMDHLEVHALKVHTVPRDQVHLLSVLLEHTVIRLILYR